MIQFKTEDVFFKQTNQAIRDTVLSEPTIGLRFKLQELLDERGLTQSAFAKMSGLRRPDVVNYCNNTFRPTLNLSHIFTMMIMLRITDIGELLEIRLDNDVSDKYKDQAADWIETKTLPQEIQSLMQHNSQL